ncbi:MAG: response regulator [Ekhidna sp.]
MKPFEKVLLIDDDDIVNSINSVIIKHAKFAREVVAYTTVAAAIAYLSEVETPPEVIFLDLNMPNLNGWDFMDEFGKTSRKGRTKVVMLTSSISLKDEKKAKTLDDVAAYISKPLSPELLKQIYEDFLSQP